MLESFRVLPHVAALALAYALAFPIGWNREREARSAGLRTFPLVAIAACGFVQAAESLQAADPGSVSRVVQGIVSGIGFIGGGAILKYGDSVRGTAKAAAVWGTGAIDVAVGLGALDVAVVISLFTVLTLRLLRPLKRRDRDAGPDAGGPEAMS